MLSRDRFTNHIASGLMACFGLVAVGRFWESGLLFYLLLAIREFLASYFFLHRLNAEVKSRKRVVLIALISSALPLFYITGLSSSFTALVVSHVAAIVGYALVTLATIELGDRLSISPETRGEFCRTGVYRNLRHPMYIGYFIAETGMLIAFPQNLLLYALSMALYFWRASIESNLQKSRKLSS